MHHVTHAVRNTKDKVLLMILKTNRKTYIKKYQKGYYETRKRISLTVTLEEREKIRVFAKKENTTSATVVKKIVL